jgi:hypothetical protein
MKLDHVLRGNAQHHVLRLLELYRGIGYNVLHIYCYRYRSIVLRL